VHRLFPLTFEFKTDRPVGQLLWRNQELFSICIQARHYGQIYLSMLLWDAVITMVIYGLPSTEEYRNGIEGLSFRNG
jgi:hypothetical protein